MTTRSPRDAVAGALRAALPMLLLAAAAHADPLTNVAARAPAESSDDPYRWMEAPTRADQVRTWLQTASDHTAAELNRMPGYPPLVAQLVAAGAATATDTHVVRRSDVVFRTRQEPDDALPKLVVRGPSGGDRVLYDPAAAQSTGAINNYSVSPDGRHVALHTASKGAEMGMIRIIDVATSRIDPEAVGPVWGELPAAWIDNETLLYVRSPAAAGPRIFAGATLARHRLGQPAADDAALLRSGGPEGLGPDELFAVGPEASSPWTLVLVSGSQADQRLFVARDDAVARGAPAWREVAGYARRMAAAHLAGDDLYAITTRTASNGEVVRIGLSSGREEVVFPAGSMVLRDILPTAAGLYVVGTTDGVEQLLFVPRDGGRPRVVALPPGGTVNDLQVAPDGRAITLVHAGWLSNLTYFRVEGAQARRLPYGAPTPTALANFEVLRDEAVSRDGARVPLTILAPRKLPRDGRAVAIVDAYGGYGLPVTPFYRTEFHVWLERGGVFAFCGVRGGGEKGREWHEAGRAGNKPNAQRDFIACGERLVQLGLTSPSRLVAHAASNGALVVGPAVLQRPDLFRAAIIRKGMLNATRIGQSRNGPNHFAEMGDPSDPAGLAGLVPQDAYLALDQASAAPDIMLSVGLNDNRVEPWFSAKFAARAQARFGDRQRVLVFAADSGHAIGDTREQLAREAAAGMAFALHVTGAPEFQLAPAIAADGGPLSGSRCGARPPLPDEVPSPSLAPGVAQRFKPASPYARRRC